MVLSSLLALNAVAESLLGWGWWILGAIVGFIAYIHRPVIAGVARAVAEYLLRESDEEGDGRIDPTGEDGVRPPPLRDDEQFDVLTDRDFTRRQPDPQNCWLRPFNLTEIKEGYAVERREKDGTSVVTELLEKLTDGENVVVVGPPGAGKTTTCNLVAHRWHEDGDTGNVVYNRKRQAIPADRERVIEKIESAREDGNVLVVAEDVARSDKTTVLEVVDEFAGDPQVSFLLDSRETEWEKLDETVRNTPGIDPDSQYWTHVQSTAKKDIEPYHMPELTVEEVERIAVQFESVTDRPVHSEPEHLFARVEAESGVSPLLLLAYHLHVGEPKGESEQSALETHVRDVKQAIESGDGFSVEFERDRELLTRVGVLANVLNVAGIGLHREFVHAVAKGERDHRKIDEFVAELYGKLHFGREDGTEYRTHHEFWSELYLAFHYEDASSKKAARETFEESVNAFFSVLEREPNRFITGAKTMFNRLPVPRTLEPRTVRAQIRDHLDGETPRIDEIDQDPGGYADQYVDGVFAIGEQNLRIAPLFSTMQRSGIEIPDSCSDVTKANCYIRRGCMHLDLGAAEQSARELKRGFDAGGGSRRVDAAYYHNRGDLALTQSDYDDAREHYQRSLGIKRELGNRQGEAKNLGNLGLVARNQGDYDAARNYHERSLTIKRELGDVAGVAASLTNLGNVAFEQETYEDAREFYEDAVEIFEDIGAVDRLLKVYKNLVRVCIELGDEDSATEYAERAISTIDESDVSGLADWREKFESYLP